MAEQQPKRVLVGARAGSEAALRSRGAQGGYRCAKCGAEVVLAAPGRNVLASEPGIVLWCYECMKPTLSKDTVIEPAPGAVEELMTGAVLTALQRASKARDN